MFYTMRLMFCPIFAHWQIFIYSYNIFSTNLRNYIFYHHQLHCRFLCCYNDHLDSSHTHVLTSLHPQHSGHHNLRGKTQDQRIFFHLFSISVSCIFLVQVRLTKGYRVPRRVRSSRRGQKQGKTHGKIPKKTDGMARHFFLTTIVFEYFKSWKDRDTILKVRSIMSLNCF